ncbi:MAG TPA: aspartate aminotransferase [Planctomycetaceae bacterium]|nr:aspartate aminotransferase [Phycisphaerae bacterium]HAY81307.1 aspartate aminotransferase [Planctomycetaceae bacterium]
MGGECTADPLGLFHGCWTGGILPDMETEMTHAMNLSKRALGVPASPTLAITARVKELKAAGEDIIGFGAGEPDFGTPEVICDAAVESLRSGQTRYAPTPGTPEAREAIADKLRTENGIECTASDIIINNGAKFTVYLALQAIVNPGDVVLLPTPAWVSYKPMIELAGGVVREIPAGPDSDFKMTADQLEAAIDDDVRAIILNSPSNPCGTMYSPEEVRALAKVLEANPRVAVIADEIYERLVYSDEPYLSMASVPAMAEQTITINGLSKTFAMTGWRIGYACAPGKNGEVIKAMTRLQSQMTSSITSFLMSSIPAALQKATAEVSSMRDTFAKRAELIHGLVTQWPGVSCPRPTGAFYIFPDISCCFGKTSGGGVRIQSAMDFASALLDEAGVAVVPGEGFLGCGVNHVRLSFACSEDDIHAGCQRVREWLDRLT